MKMKRFHKKIVAFTLSLAMTITSFDGCSVRNTGETYTGEINTETVSDNDIEEVVEQKILLSSEDNERLIDSINSVEESNIELIEVLDDLRKNDSDYEAIIQKADKLVETGRKEILEWQNIQNEIYDDISDKMSAESYSILSERKEKLFNDISDNVDYAAEELDTINKLFVSDDSEQAIEKAAELIEFLNGEDYIAYGHDNNTNALITPPVDNEKVSYNQISFSDRDEDDLEYITAEFETPLELYNYLKNNVHTEFYYGCRKTPLSTFDSLSGNDYDQAVLLATILRRMGYEAKYVKGDILIAPETALSMTGTDSIEIAANVFAMAGVPVTKLKEKSGNIRYLKIEHVWVRAEIPYTDYRGAGEAAGDYVWVDLDTSIKPYEDVDNIFDYLENSQEMKDIRSHISATEISINYQNVDESIDVISHRLQSENKELYNRRRIIKEDYSEYLPLSLQYTVDKETEVTDSLDVSDKVSISIAGESLGTYNAAFLNDKSVVIGFEPATESDREILESSGGIFNAVASYVYVKPVLYINNIKVCEAEDTEFTLGERLNVGINLSFVGNVPETSKYIENICTAGATYALTLDTQTVSAREMNNAYVDMLYHYADIEDDTPLTTENLGVLLSFVGKEYFAMLDAQNIMATEMMDVADVRRLSVAITGYDVKRITSYNVVTKLDYGNLFIDVDADDHYLKDRKGDTNKEKICRYHLGLNGSANEGFIWTLCCPERNRGTVSTVSILEKAKKDGIEILKLDKTNINEKITTLDGLKLSKSEINRIKTDIEAGKIVVIPEENITIESWNGTGYIVLDPDTGAGAYMISGGLNGGANPFIMKIRDAIESGSVDCMYFAAIFKEYIVSEVMLQVLMYMTFATPLDLLVGVAAISIIVACFLYSCVITYAYLDYILEDDDENDDEYERMLEWYNTDILDLDVNNTIAKIKKIKASFDETKEEFIEETEEKIKKYKSNIKEWIFGENDNDSFKNFNPDTASNKQKGNYAEYISNQYLLNSDEIKEKGYTLKSIGREAPTDINDKLRTGIDAVYEVTDNKVDGSKVKYIIVEVKYDTSKLSNKPADGRQMKDAWLRGDKTGYDRILEAVKDDDKLSKDITQGLNNGKTIKLLAEVTPEGNVEYKILDSEGKETGQKWP